MPLSICSATLRAVHASHPLHVSCTVCGSRMLSTTVGCTTNDAKKPPDACHAMWQWKPQTPRWERKERTEAGQRAAVRL